MCGIYGSTKIYPKDIVLKKLESIKFRGPDASSYEVIGDKILLGHNRLSILDLDPRSNQPLTYQYVTIVFNGEVYNYIDIKNTLRDKGYQFTTTSDTEVLCAAYIEYGVDAVNLFNGMFSLVIYDEKKNLLFGARDRLGQKPFYYYNDGSTLEFGSQLKQLGIENTFTVDDEAIAQYLCWNYVPDPNTIYKEVKKLPAGHYFIYDLESKALSVTQYWDIPKHEEKISNYQEAKSTLKELISDSVSMRMLSDVPLGVFLSGGIDSSLVAAMAADHSKGEVKTFSIKFSEDSFDESSYARQVADVIGSNHTEILCSYDEGLDMIDGISEFYDEPFADSSMLPSMLLAKHTRKHVTVALSGDAGDESFLGYTRYDWMNKVAPIFKLPHFTRKLIGKTLNLSSNYRHRLIGKGISLESLDKLYISMMSSLNDVWHKDTISGRNIPYQEYLSRDNNLVETISDFDLKTYLNGDINTKVDRATMAFSLESRAPLMDYRVVEFAKSIPTHFKYDKGNKKRILKDVLYDYVDKEIFERPKSGFGVPLEIWFRNELKEMVLDKLSLNNLKNLTSVIDADIVYNQIQEHMSGKANRSDLIWKLIVLQDWMKNFV